MNRLFQNFKDNKHRLLLLLLDLVIDKHGYFPWEGAPQFFAAYGFASCVVVITIAKILRFFLKGGEDYYD